MPLEYPSYVKSNVKPGCYVKLLLSPISPSGGGRSLGDDFIAGAGSVGIVTSVRPDALLNELGFQIVCSKIGRVRIRKEFYSVG